MSGARCVLAHLPKRDPGPDIGPLPAEGMIVTNPRLIITVISIVLGTFLLVDFILQILIHYERIGYTNIYLFHELKWPWLYVLAW